MKNVIDSIWGYLWGYF